MIIIRIVHVLVELTLKPWKVASHMNPFTFDDGQKYATVINSASTFHDHRSHQHSLVILIQLSLYLLTLVTMK